MKSLLDTTGAAAPDNPDDSLVQSAKGNDGTSAPPSEAPVVTSPEMLKELMVDEPKSGPDGPSLFKVSITHFI
jgi:hypothetical protein